jgi:phenol/toluene 2-monooxygenase (NADH) P1/A1
MSYDLSPQVIEPRRLTFDNLAKRIGQREATRYEEATIDVQPEENFHYRPLYNPAIEIFDTSMTTLKLEDWYTFSDPRQFYYGPYNQTRNKMMEVLDGEINYAGERGLLDKIAGDWRKIFLSYLLPMRHYEYGGNIVMCYVSRFAYGTSIEQCASFNAFDKMGNSQIITKFCLNLPNADQLLSEAKQNWLEAEHLQPLRELIENTWLITDWAEAIFVQNLLVDGILYSLLYDSFDRVALDNGALAVTFVHKFLADWNKENTTWTISLAETFVNDPQNGEANRAAIQEMLDKWADKVVAAVEPLGKVFEMPTLPGDFSAALTKALQTVERNLDKVGFSLKVTAKEAVLAPAG